MLSDALEGRLKAAVAGLNSHVLPAADLANMVAQKALPQGPVTAFVLPGGLRPRPADSAAGAFTQELAEGQTIVLVLRTAGDGTGGKSLKSLGVLVSEILGAVCGWVPDASDDDSDIYLPLGPFELTGGQLVRVDAGTLFYQIDVACPVQLRIL